MPVRRIVPIIAAADVASAADFYAGVLDLDVAMDLGWIVTYAAPSDSAVQISIASHGGSGMPVPSISIEVDDLDAVLTRLAAAGITPEYGPVAEPWGVRRVFVRDPFGSLVNIVCHA